MSIFELILFVFIFTALVLNIIPAHNRWAAFAYAAAATVVIPLCILSAGARQQMCAAYALTAALLVAGMVRYAKKPERKHIIKSKALRVTVSVFAVIVFVFSVLLPALSPRT